MYPYPHKFQFKISFALLSNVSEQNTEYSRNNQILILQRDNPNVGLSNTFVFKQYVFFACCWAKSWVAWWVLVPHHRNPNPSVSFLAFFPPKSKLNPNQLTSACTSFNAMFSFLTYSQPTIFVNPNVNSKWSIFTNFRLIIFNSYGKFAFLKLQEEWAWNLTHIQWLA